MLGRQPETKSMPIRQGGEERGSDQHHGREEVSDAERPSQSRDTFRGNDRGHDAQKQAQPGQPPQRRIVDRREQIETGGRAHHPRQQGWQDVIEQHMPHDGYRHEQLFQHLRAPARAPLVRLIAIGHLRAPLAGRLPESTPPTTIPWERRHAQVLEEERQVLRE